MAIDTPVKRKSVAGVARPWRPGVVVPDGTIDAADRQAIGWTYAGIASVAAVEERGLEDVAYFGMPDLEAHFGLSETANFGVPDLEAEFNG